LVNRSNITALYTVFDTIGAWITLIALGAWLTKGWLILGERQKKNLESAQFALWTAIA
jgi:hypothetical protein